MLVTASFQNKKRLESAFYFFLADMRIVAGTAGTPEEPPKKNTLKIKILFASQ